MEQPLQLQKDNEQLNMQQNKNQQDNKSERHLGADEASNAQSVSQSDLQKKVNLSQNAAAQILGNSVYQNYGAAVQRQSVRDTRPAKELSLQEKIELSKQALNQLFSKDLHRNYINYTAITGRKEKYSKEERDYKKEEKQGIKNKMPHAQISGSMLTKLDKEMLSAQHRVSMADRELGEEFWMLANELEESHRGKKKDSDDMAEVKQAVVMLRNTADLIEKSGADAAKILKTAKQYFINAASQYVSRKGRLSFTPEGYKRKHIVMAMLGKVGVEKYRESSYALKRSAYNIRMDDERYTHERTEEEKKNKKLSQEQHAAKQAKESEIKELAERGMVVVTNQVEEDKVSLLFGYKDGKMVSLKDEDNAVPDKLMINDIKQGNCGDCYFLAELVSYVEEHPEEKDNFIVDNGNTVTVRFFDVRECNDERYRDNCRKLLQPENIRKATDRELVQSVFMMVIEKYEKHVAEIADRLPEDVKNLRPQIEEAQKIYEAVINKMDKLNKQASAAPDPDYHQKIAQLQAELGTSMNELMKLTKVYYEKINAQLQNENMVQLYDSIRYYVDFKKVNGKIDEMMEKPEYESLVKQILALAKMEPENIVDASNELYNQILKDNTVMGAIFDNTTMRNVKSTIETLVPVYVTVNKDKPVYKKSEYEAASQGHDWVKLVEKAYALSGIRDADNDRAYDEEQDKYNTKDLDAAYTAAKEYVRKKLGETTDTFEVKEEARRLLKRSYANIEGGLSENVVFHLTGVKSAETVLRHLTVDESDDLTSVTRKMSDILNGVYEQAPQSDTKEVVTAQKDACSTILAAAVAMNKSLMTKVKVKETDSAKGKEVIKEQQMCLRAITLEDIKDSVDSMIEKIDLEKLDDQKISRIKDVNEKALYESVKKVITTDQFKGCKTITEKKEALHRFLDSVYFHIENAYDDIYDGINNKNLPTINHRSIVNHTGMQVKYTKKANDVYEKLRKKILAKEKAVMGTYVFKPLNAVGKTGLNNEQLGNSLVERHAYTILDCDEIDGTKFVTIRNPWANYGIRLEKHSDGKGNVTTKYVLDETNGTQGSFTMELNDFLSKLSHVSV